DGLRIGISDADEETATGLEAFGIFRGTPNLRDGAVALIEPAGEGDEGAVSDVASQSVRAAFGMPNSFLVQLFISSDLDPGPPLVPPRGANNVNEQNGILQDLSQAFTDEHGNPVAVPYNFAMNSDPTPEPSSLLLLGTSALVVLLHQGRRRL